jgi:hypothetical protein
MVFDPEYCHGGACPGHPRGAVSRILEAPRLRHRVDNRIKSGHERFYPKTSPR